MLATVHPTLNDHKYNMRPTCVIHAVWRHFILVPSTSFSQVPWLVLWLHHQFVTDVTVWLINPNPSCSKNRKRKRKEKKIQEKEKIKTESTVNDLDNPLIMRLSSSTNTPIPQNLFWCSRHYIPPLPDFNDNWQTRWVFLSFYSLYIHLSTDWTIVHLWSRQDSLGPFIFQKWLSHEMSRRLVQRGVQYKYIFHCYVAGVWRAFSHLLLHYK